MIYKLIEPFSTIIKCASFNGLKLMKRAIVEFATHIQQNPNQISRHMFL